MPVGLFEAAFNSSTRVCLMVAVTPCNYKGYNQGQINRMPDTPVALQMLKPLSFIVQDGLVSK